MDHRSSRRKLIKDMLAGSAVLATGSQLLSSYSPKSKPEQSLKLKGNIHHSVCRWCYDSIPLETFCQDISERLALAFDLQVALGDRLLQRHFLQLNGVQRRLAHRELRIRLGERLAIVQDRVLDHQSVLLLQIGEVDIEADLLARRLRPIQPHCEVIEQHVRRHRPDRVGTRGVDASCGRHAVAQFVRALQVHAAPRAGFGLIAELLVGIREQGLGRLVVGIGEHDVLERRGDEAVFALVEVGLRTLQDRVFSAHVLDVLLRRRFRRQVVQVRRVAVVPAHVALVDGASVVAQRTVVATVRPVVLKLRAATGSFRRSPSRYTPCS